MLKNSKFEVEKVEFNKIILKNGCLMPEKKIYQKNIDFSSKKSAPKKGPYAVPSFEKSLVHNKNTKNSYSNYMIG